MADYERVGFFTIFSHYYGLFIFFQDHVIIQLDQTGLTKSDTELVREDDPILVVHPNYVVDS